MHVRERVERREGDKGGGRTSFDYASESVSETRAQRQGRKRAKARKHCRRSGGSCEENNAMRRRQPKSDALTCVLRLPFCSHHSTQDTDTNPNARDNGRDSSSVQIAVSEISISFSLSLPLIRRQTVLLRQEDSGMIMENEEREREKSARN